METEPPVIPPSSESTLFGISIRSLIALVCVLCVCAICTYGAIQSKDFEVHEPLYSLVMMAVGFFFGQKQTKQ